MALKEPLRHAPFLAVFFYVAVSILTFWWGAIPWPVNNGVELAAYQLASLVFLVGGYFSVGATKRTHRSIRLRPVFFVGMIAVIALQIPLTLTYTGKYPWDVFGAVMDQRTVYEEMLDKLASTSGERFYIPLVRAIVMPFFFAAVGYGLLNFRELSFFRKVLLLAGLLCPVNLSLLRGTDKEIADLIVIVSGFMLIANCRKTESAQQAIFFGGGNAKRLILILVFVFVFFLFFILFSHRKLERLGGDVDFCIVHGLICADYSGGVLSSLPDFLAFGIAMVSSYLTNGYYGLSLALELPFEPAYGLGHSSALLSLYERISGGTTLFESTYTARLSELGWDHRYYWSSLYTSLANDVHFSGALIIVGLLARWFRQAWLDAVYAHDDLAAVVFVLLCIAFFYLPANNQLAQTFDLYFSFIGTLLVWKLRRGGRSRTRDCSVMTQ